MNVLYRRYTMGSRGKGVRRGTPRAMTYVCYGLLPCDRARRVGWQLLNGQARCMGVEKLLHGLARMVTRSILNHDDVAPSLRQHVEQKGRIACRVKASHMSFVEK